jgi:V/A-type H+-transporting ATPase subunit E
VVAKMTEAEVKKALTSAEFVKEVILAVAKGFNTDEPVDLELVLPESLKAELEPFVKSELAKVLKADVQASFTKKVAGGFTIGPKDGGYFISFTEETFNALIAEYLRPATKKILFG